MNGFECKDGDVDLSKKRLIDGMIYYLKEFLKLDRKEESGLKDFLNKHVDEDTNYVVRSAHWTEQDNDCKRFIFLLTLAGVLPVELAPWLKDSCCGGNDGSSTC